MLASRNRKQKVLLMGPGKGGKTSMRSIIFANYLARDCQRLGLTIELERSQVTFLSNLQLNLWDCGGQTSFIDNYLKRSREFIFSDVAVLIYVFDLEALSKRSSDDDGERETLPLPSEVDDEVAAAVAAAANGGGGGSAREHDGGMNEGTTSSVNNNNNSMEDNTNNDNYNDNDYSSNRQHHPHHHSNNNNNSHPQHNSNTNNNAEMEWSRERVMSYFVSCVEAIRQHSPEAQIFCLLHKKDRLVHTRRDQIIARREEEIQSHVPDVSVRYFATSIWDDSLFKAWSSILNALVPDSEVLNRRLRDEVLARGHVYEVALFEKSTSLCISYQHHHHPHQQQQQHASSSHGGSSSTSPTTVMTTSTSATTVATTSKSVHSSSLLGTHDTPTRISNIIKKFKLSCMRDARKFCGLSIVTSEYTAILEDFTENTMILVVSNEPEVSLMVHRLNTNRARREFDLFLRSPEGAAMSEVL